MSNDHATPSSSQLSQHRVWRHLPATAHSKLAGQWEIKDHAEGQLVASSDDLHERLYWLLQGQVRLCNSEGQPVLDLDSGELFGQQSTGSDAGVQHALAANTCRTASLSAAQLDALCEAHPALAYLLQRDGQPKAPPSGHSGGDPALNLLTTPVSRLIKRQPITLPPSTTIREAAEVMREQRVSSVLIVEQAHLFGLITDRDLRNRVIAAGVDTDRPIMDIATLAPLSIGTHSPAFEALLLMARHNIHHVPVLDGQRIAGMITATDLTEQHSTSAVYLAGDIYKKTSIEELQASSLKIKRLQQNLAAAEASAYNTGHIITAITDAITIRLLQLGEAKLGPPPIDYVWVAAGSQARNEQTAKSDQDNCLVLDPSYNGAEHGAYFKALATFVCDGLDACGYIHCPGDMMAMNDTWRLPQQRWADLFARWTGQPDPKSLMLTCVFFDLRAVHGKTQLLDDLRRDVLQRTKGNSIFLAYMVGNAMGHQPPLGMFGGINTLRSGEHKGTIDLKHNGIVPIVDLARVYALAGGDAAVNTHDRLLSAASSGAISEQSARDLRDALEFLAYMRIQHQARQIAKGQDPDNYLFLNELSNFERTQLKDAFNVVQTLQNVLGQRFQAGRF